MLLEYENQFMRSPHVVDRVTDPNFTSLSFTYDIGVQLILCNNMLNQLYNWILRGSVLLWVSVVPTLSLYTMLT